jgi:tripartite-type tricarboxylate transporter receptor subunit TctC
MRRRGFAIALGIASAMLPMVAVSAAGEEAEFYRGKTITIIIPIGPGGAYDAYARLVARHLGRKLPGEPAIVPRNMPGGGGVIASNYLYNVAPRDGTTLAIITSSFANEQLFGSSVL